MIKREEFLMELKEERKFRKILRNLIENYFKKQKKEALQESKLREIIKKLIKEAATTDVPDAQPHNNTGINVLEDLLKNIIPTIEDDYKALTSSKKQRSSFRAHILTAIQNTLAPVEVIADLDDEELEEQDLNINVEDEESKFLPVRDVDAEPEEEEPESFASIEGMDETGRNFASITFNKVQKQTIDSYESLANETDRTLFYDYLLTNLKLYFDKFEDELQINVTEPSSPDYKEEPEEIDLEDELDLNV